MLSCAPPCRVSVASLHRGAHGKPQVCTLWPRSSLHKSRWEGGGGLGWGPKPVQCPCPSLRGGIKTPSSSSVQFTLPWALPLFVPPTEQRFQLKP